MKNLLKVVFSKSHSGGTNRAKPTYDPSNTLWFFCLFVCFKKVT